MIHINLKTDCVCTNSKFKISLFLFTNSKKYQIEKETFVKIDESNFQLTLKSTSKINKVEYILYDRNEVIIKTGTIKNANIREIKNINIVLEKSKYSHICDSLSYTLEFIENTDQNGLHDVCFTTAFEELDSVFLYIKYVIPPSNQYFYTIFKVNKYHNAITMLNKWNENNIIIQEFYLIDPDKKIFSFISKQKIHLMKNLNIKFKGSLLTITDLIPSYVFECKAFETLNSKNCKIYFRFFHSEIISLLKGANEEIIIAMYNLEDMDIVNEIIDAKIKRNVNIFVLTSYKFMYKRHNKQLDSYQQLLNHFIPVYAKLHPIRNDKNIFASMHTKLCIIDNQTTVTGSVNWEYHSCNNNEEVMTVYHSNTQIAKFYKEMICNIVCPSFNKVELPQWINIYDTQRDRNLFIQDICQVLKSTNKGDIVYMAMFILMDFQLEWDMSLEDQQKTKKREKYSVMDELRLCTERGVELRIIVEKNTNDEHFGQYYNERIVPNRFLDYIQNKWQNTSIWRVKTYRGNNMYSAIHHKFCIVNDYSIYGSANWWNISFESDDDIVILNDHEIAKAFIKEWYRLISPTFTVNNVPTNLEKYEQIKNILVEIFLDEEYSKSNTVEMIYNKSLNEYYGEYIYSDETFHEMQILLKKPIKYRYQIITKNTTNNEIQIDYDIIRSKMFNFYKATDNWGCNSINDKLCNDIIVI